MPSLAWRRIALSLHGGCGVTIQGTAICWGSNRKGQLGIAPDTLASHEPKPLEGLPPLAEIGVSSDHVCALTSSGEMYCWGNNENGQLGRGTFTTWEAPGRVIGAQRFSVFDLTSFATCAVTTDGIAYCWGDGSSMPLGYQPEQECPDGRAADEDGTVHISHCSPVPQAITADVRFTGIVVGPFVPCGLTKHGQMICWENQQEQHGNETVMGPPRFYREGDLPALISISAGGHRCGLTMAHVVWCWGSNLFGQLARPEHLDAETYVPRPSAEGLQFIAVSAGDTHTCGITTDRHVYCWGDNRWGQVGTAHNSERPTLVPIP